MVGKCSHVLVQFPGREKRRQALLGSNLPRDISVSDAPMACLALVGTSRQGPLFFHIGHRSYASENPLRCRRRALESDEPSFCSCSKYSKPTTQAGTAGKQLAKGYLGLRFANGVSGPCRRISTRAVVFCTLDIGVMPQKIHCVSDGALESDEPELPSSTDYR